jgi:hypothetical protein
VAWTSSWSNWTSHSVVILPTIVLVSTNSIHRRTRNRRRPAATSIWRPKCRGARWRKKKMSGRDLTRRLEKKTWWKFHSFIHSFIHSFVRSFAVLMFLVL